MDTIRLFFLKSGQFFPIFKKEKGKVPLPLSLVSRLEVPNWKKIQKNVQTSRALFPKNLSRQAVIENVLLKKDGSVSIHNRNLQKFLTEICKLCKDLSTLHMTQLFEPRNQHPYNIRHVSQFNTQSRNTIYCGSKSISFLGPEI